MASSPASLKGAKVFSSTAAALEYIRIVRESKNSGAEGSGHSQSNTSNRSLPALPPSTSKNLRPSSCRALVVPVSPPPTKKRVIRRGSNGDGPSAASERKQSPRTRLRRVRSDGNVGQMTMITSSIQMEDLLFQELASRRAIRALKQTQAQKSQATTSSKWYSLGGLGAATPFVKPESNRTASRYNSSHTQQRQWDVENPCHGYSDSGQTTTACQSGRLRSVMCAISLLAVLGITLGVIFGFDALNIRG